MVVKSEIKSVTVYKDRALVERIAQPELNPGEHTLVFSGLPLGIDAASVQVSGGKNAVLQDIKVKDVYLDELPDEQKKDIMDEIEELHELIEEFNNKMTNLNEEKKFLLNLSSVSAESSKKTILALLVPDKMESMLKFYSDKLNKLDDALRANKKEQKKLDKRLQILKTELKKFNQKNLSAEKQVELRIFVKEQSEVDLILSYIVFNAGWSPVYDLRLDSNEKKLTVAYNALVRQKTGEKWENVKLNLSTARPQLSGDTPSLSAWFVNIYKTVAMPVFSPMKAKKEVMRSAKISPEGILDDEFNESEEEAPMEIAEAAVESGATSVVFSIPGNNTILDNFDEHKIGISNLDFEAKLEYNSVPKISPSAYLTAIISNTSEYPMLAGKTNIFLDNSFVSHSTVKLIAPNEEFKCSLGIDEGINIEHRLVNRFTKDEGLFSKKSKIIFEYKIIVKNNKKSESEIRIKDQVPLSQNQEIKIEMLEPKIKENTDELKKSDDGSIEWKLILQPAEKKQMMLKFTVEFPKDEIIIGLE